jgi:hypothetical protein
MASIWFAPDGPGEQEDGPFRETTVDECVARLGLRQNQHVTDLDRTPRFNVDGPSSRWNERSVVRIGEGEAPGWRAGYYLLELRPREVVQRFAA